VNSQFNGAQLASSGYLWPKTYSLADGSRLRIAMAAGRNDWDVIYRLRQAVYVDGEGRLGSVEDMSSTFDRFNAKATYFIASVEGSAVGCIKVIADSENGLPCDEIVDLSRHRREGAVIVELGHVATLPQVRHHGIGRSLMREGLIFAVSRVRATHIIGDFFVESGTDGLRRFYTALGFEPLSEPYADARFKNAPLSIVGILEIAKGVKLYREAAGKASSLLSFYFGDYDLYAHPSEPGER
jgi:predicted GNAT family N-acyltransferase